jgi:hypothetical protein
MRRLTVVSLLAAGVVVAAGITPIAVAAPSLAPKASISWGTCDDPGLADAGAQCGLVSVPLDYAKPNGAKIKLAVSRIKHTVPDAKA